MTDGKLVATEWLSKFQQDISQMIYAKLEDNSIQSYLLFNDPHMIQSFDRARNSIEDCLECISMILNKTKSLIKEKQTGYSVTDQAASYLLANLEKCITRDALARSLYISPGYLSRVFNKAHGCSISEFVNRERIKRAKTFLTDTGLTIAEISFKLGYSSSSNFCVQFKRRTGVTPTEYRTNAE